jgi:hypothetical protein
MKCSLIVAVFLAVASMLWVRPGARAIGGEMDELTTPISPQSRPRRPDSVARQAVMCGPNSLYLLLGLNGIKVDASEIEKLVPLHQDGMSLTEMRDASNALGLRTKVMRLSLAELRHNFQSPFIAYLNFDQHYVVVIDVDEKTVTMLDGTTGDKEEVSITWLEKRWSGYVLMPESDSFPWLLLGAGFGLAFVVGFVCAARISRMRK